MRSSMAKVPFIITNDMYEKLTDDILYVAANLVLRLNVVLGRKNSSDGSRMGFHNDYIYESSKYSNVNKSITMRRHFDYFLTLENIKDTNGVKESIMIRVNDMIPLRDMLNEVSKWFFDQKYKDLFAYDNSNKLVLINKIDPVWIRGFAADKSIKIEPTVVTLWNDSLVEGVRMYLNSDNNFIDIPSDRLMGLIYIIGSIDLFSAAQNLINFLGISPIEERAIRSFNDINIEQQCLSEDLGGADGKKGRVVRKKSQSFFDKMDDL